MSVTHFSERIGSSLCGSSDESDKGTAIVEVVTCHRCLDRMEPAVPGRMPENNDLLECPTCKAQVARICLQCWDRRVALKHSKDDYATLAAKEWFEGAQRYIDSIVEVEWHPVKRVSAQAHLDKAVDKLAAIIRKHVEPIRGTQRGLLPATEPEETL